MSVGWRRGQSALISTVDEQFCATFYDIFTPLRCALTPSSRVATHVAVVSSDGGTIMRFDLRRNGFPDVDSFLDFLAELSFHDWLLLGEDWTNSTSGEELDAMARLQRLSFDAWLVCDSVETIAFLATCSTAPHRRSDRRAIARSRRVVEQVALAILERSSCDPERSSCDPERSSCHPERSSCHPERSEGSLSRRGS